MLFWFRDSCHWYREATLFRVRALGAVTQNKSAVVNPMEKEQRMCHTLRRGRSCACVRVCVSSNLPVLYTINCDLAQTVEGTVWRTSVRCGPSVLRLHFFPTAPSQISARSVGREKKNISHKHPHLRIQTGYRKHTRCTYACAQHARALTYTHKRRARRHTQLVWIGVLHIWLWFMIALQ